MEITYAGRTFQVTETGNELMPYVLRGARGAKYTLLRHQTQPAVLTATMLRPGRVPKVKEDWIFTDKDGELRGI